jgi:ankyrin repeat protein
MSANVESRFFGDMGDDYIGLYETVRKLDNAFETDNANDFLKFFRKYVRIVSRYQSYWTNINYIFLKAIKEEKHNIIKKINKVYNPEENAAVYWATLTDNEELVKNLVERGLKDNLALEAAYKNNNIEMFNLLFDNGMRFRQDGERYKFNLY